jgi:predicted permease
MAQILIKSASFIFLIALGYFLKRIGFFAPTDYKIAVKIVINIAMPYAVLVSFA